MPPAAPAAPARTPATPRILVIEDAPDVRTLVEGVLRAQRYDVEGVADGETGMERIAAWAPDVVVLDVGLPGIDGVEVCRRLRTVSDAHVIMLTGRDDEVDKIVGLSVGADDYVTKPFSPRELSARVQAMLRRRTAQPVTTAPVAPDPTRRFGALAIDPVGHEVRIDGEPVELTAREFALLDTLSAEPNVAFSRALLLTRVWGENWFGDDHVVDAHISNLRRKIEPQPGAQVYVRTVRGVGYRMGRG